MQDASEQPDAAATENAAACNDLVRTFTSQLTSHCQVFHSLVLEFEKQILVLEEKNQSIRRQLLAGSVVADLESQSMSHACFEATVVDLDCLGDLPTEPMAIDPMRDNDENNIGNHEQQSKQSEVSANSEGLTVEQYRQSRKKTKFRRAPPMMHPDWTPPRSHLSFASKQHSLENLVNSKKFEILSALIILLNTVVMALQLQYDGFDVGHDLEWSMYSKPARQTWPWFKDFSKAASILFNSAFCIELLIRVLAAGRHAFCHPWIAFDTIIVSLSMMFLILPSGSIPINPGMMRVLRLVRLVRLLKLLKTMTAFDSLFLLLKSVRASMHAAFWSFLMLFTIQLIVGLFLNQVLLDYASDEQNSIKSREEVFRYFGTFSRSLLTMFEITFANWVVSCRMLLEYVSEWFMLLFLVYRCFFCFAVLKVISAVFITETNRVLEHDDELTVMKKSRDKLLLSRKVHSLTQNLRQTDQGLIGWDAFEEIAQDKDMARLLWPLGFDIHDLEKLFWLLQDGSGLVQIDDFLNKVGRLRGTAKSIDAQTLLTLTHRIDELIHDVFSKQGYTELLGAEQKAIEDKACSM